MSHVWSNFKDLLFPAACLFCKQPNSWICQKCFNKIKINDSPYCFSCRQLTDKGELCANCRPNYHLDGALIAGQYEDLKLQTLIKKLKYQFLSEIGPHLGKFLSFYLQTKIFANPLLNSGRSLNSYLKISPAGVLIVPVPLSKRRLKWRGFNQSEILAKTVADYFNFPLTLDLRRVFHTQPQVDLNKNRRETNLVNAFKWTGPNLNQAQIILIDDVLTTGATLNDGARALKTAGASQVWGLVLAQG